MIELGGMAFLFAAAAAFAGLWLRARLALRATGRDPVLAAAAGRPAAAQPATASREILDALPVPVWRCGPERELVECNRAYAALFATTREALLDERRQPALTATAPRRHLVVEGRRRLFEIGEIASPSGGTIGFAIDRTETEAAHAELRRHIDAHGDVLDGIHAGVAIYDADRRLKYFNAAFAGLWGLGEDWLLAGPTFDEILEWLRERRRIPEQADFRAFKQHRLELFTGLLELRQEMMHLPDGRTLQLQISPHPLGGLVFLYEDVTDHLALESSFNTLAQVQRATIDHLYEGIAVYGADGRLKLHNPAFRQIWDLSEADIAGEPHIAAIVDKTRALIDEGGDWPAQKQAIIDRVAAQIPTSGVLRRRDGSVLQAAAVPLPDGKVLLTYLDVSDTACVEQALRDKNEALETAGRLKSEFIANVSRELRDPLNTIQGFTEILINQYFGPLNARQLDYGRGIFDSARGLMALIDDILDLATIEAGYMVLERRRVTVARMLEKIVSLTRDRAQSRGLRIDLYCPPQLGTIGADQRRLEQALFNLVSNAIKFTPPGGTISIEAERAGGEMLLSVADSGIGIPPADHARVFEKFERGRHQSGAGLGLSLVKSLIELHGGTVGIESAPDHGTRITCRLPLRGRPAGPTRAAGQASSAAGRKQKSQLHETAAASTGPPIAG